MGQYAPVYDTGQQAGTQTGLAGSGGGAPANYTTTYFSLQNQSATGNGFEVTAGIYLCECVATFGGGSVTLQKLGPDGTTWLTVLTFTTNGTQTAYLTRGTMRWGVSGGATGVYTQLGRCPLR